MATLAIALLSVMILVWVGSEYLRRRDPLLRDVMLLLAAVPTMFVLSVLRLVGVISPRTTWALLALVLLGQPFFALRLVSRLRPVRNRVLGVAFAAWLLSAVPVVLLPPPLPASLIWPIVGAFVLSEAVAAVLLSREAGRRAGAARIRLRCAAAGTGLFGAALLVAGGRAAVAHGDAVLADAVRAAALLSALMYLLAFMPPRWLRRIWSQGAAYTAMRQILDAPVDEAAQQTWERYCQQAGEVLGADEVVVLVPAPGGTARPVGRTGADLPQQRYDRTDLDGLLVHRVTIDALAGYADPPRVAVDLATVTGIRFVTAAPLPQPARSGALVLLHRCRTLFAADDITLFADLASHAAALADRAALLAERERLAVIVDSSHDAIIGKTLDGVITSWNSSAERLYGYPAAEMIGRHAAMLFPPGQEDVEARLMARIARGERIEQYQVQRRRRDGSIVTVSLTLSPITDRAGNTIGVASISRDISERQRAEAMFQRLLESAPDAIIGVDRHGAIVLINAQAERLFGYARAELLGESIEVLVPAALRASHLEHMERYFAEIDSGPTGPGQALAAMRKDGTEFPAEISLSTLDTGEGVIVSAAIRDVTERLAAQADRERLVMQAERDAAERRLQHARRLESLGQLAGGVAHDFNNILAVIANYTELIVETLDAPDPRPADLAAARTDLAQITRAVDRATRLTKQLLAFGRREITQPEILSLNHVIGDVEQMLRRTLGEHIHLITDLDRRLWTVCADASQIEQILLNLAVNARDAMPSGGTLSIDTTNLDLTADDVTGSALSAGRYVRLRVSDTGTGMPPEVAERAFEPFYTTKPAGSGTGLGLATVYGIAVAAGGDVRLYSEAGIGTTITVLLPVTDATTESPSPDRSVPTVEAPRRSAPHETILLVEDETDLREATTRILARTGYEVLAAAGGEDGLRVAETHPGPIHLLLTDVIMPKMMGNEVAARMRQLRPGIPVLYMSGYAQPVLTEHGTLPANVTIIEKPFTRRQLLDRIDHVLHRAAYAPADPTP